MAKISKYRKSRYLRKEEVPEPVTLTIDHVSDENVASDGDPEDIRAVAYWKKPDVKPMVLNITNLEMIGEMLGTDDTNDFSDTSVEVYVDNGVRFGREKTGGLRVRPPEATAKPIQSDNTEFDDAITF